MADCCKTPTKNEFLLSKAKNFRAYISDFSPAPEIQQYLEKFDESYLVPTILTVVVPIVEANKTEGAVEDLMKKLSVPDDKKQEVKTKLIRYLDMFATIVLS